MTKRNFQAKEYAAEQQAYVNWPEPPQANLFEDTNISANYLEQMALVMRKTNLKGASYVEDIASQLRDLGDDYARLLNEREKLRDRIAQLETEKELLEND